MNVLNIYVKFTVLKLQRCKAQDFCHILLENVLSAVTQTVSKRGVKAISYTQELCYLIIYDEFSQNHK